MHPDFYLSGNFSADIVQFMHIIHYMTFVITKINANVPVQVL